MCALLCFVNVTIMYLNPSVYPRLSLPYNQMNDVHTNDANQVHKCRPDKIRCGIPYYQHYKHTMKLISIMWTDRCIIHNKHSSYSAKHWFISECLQIVSRMQMCNNSSKYTFFYTKSKTFSIVICGNIYKCFEMQRSSCHIYIKLTKPKHITVCARARATFFLGISTSTFAFANSSIRSSLKLYKLACTICYNI